MLAAAIAVTGAGTQTANAAYPGQAGKIAFESQATGNSEILVMNPDGTGSTNVTNNTAATDTDPVWSPNGSKIAFVRACPAPCGQGHPNIFVMNADGSGQQNLTPEPVATGNALCPDSNGGTGVPDLVARRDEDRVREQQRDHGDECGRRERQDESHLHVRRRRPLSRDNQIGVLF